MSDESVITIEIRGHEKAALEVAHRISSLFLSSGPCGCGVRPARMKWKFSSTRTSAGVSVRVATSTLRRRRAQVRFCGESGRPHG
ncbi:hypothetical protein ABT246_42540 [Streptomyces sp. NPDC001553]|uniref:hypothetical protein n=1 Tax=Streptomyces sp. NPDC001553 TaxID=3154385 RepID=UPI00331D6645